jgi:hypothetical protein
MVSLFVEAEASPKLGSVTNNLSSFTSAKHTSTASNHRTTHLGQELEETLVLLIQVGQNRSVLIAYRLMIGEHNSSLQLGLRAVQDAMVPFVCLKYSQKLFSSNRLHGLARY